MTSQSQNLPPKVKTKTKTGAQRYPALWAPIAQAHQIGTLLDACDRLDDAVLLLHSIRASLPADAARALAAPSQPTTPIVTTEQQEDAC
jgi:hypothetical protein